MEHKTNTSKLKTYIENNTGFLSFVAGGGVVLLITGLVLGALWQQNLQVEKQKLSYADVLPEVEQLVKGQEVEATVMDVNPSNNAALVVRLATTGKNVPITTTQNTDIQKRVSKEKETYQKEVDEFQKKIQSGDFKDLKQPKSYTTKRIKLASISQGQEVVIKPQGNVVGNLRIPAKAISVIQDSSSE